MNKTIEQTNEQSLNNFFDDIGTAPMTRIPYVKRLLFAGGSGGIFPGTNFLLSWT